jgi:hypothetical protein
MTDGISIVPIGGGSAAAAEASQTQTFDDAVRAQTANSTEIPTDKLLTLGAGLSASLIIPLIMNTMKYAKEATEGFDE